MATETLGENIGPALVQVLVCVYGNKAQAGRALGLDRAVFTHWQRGSRRPHIESLRKLHMGCPECRPLIDGLFQGVA